MDQDVIDQLEHLLVTEPVDEDYLDLRIVAARVTSTPITAAQVDVAWEFRGNTGDFSRPFAAEEVQILANPAYDDAALAFAAWVRAELTEHISELIEAGELRSG